MYPVENVPNPGQYVSIAGGTSRAFARPGDDALAAQMFPLFSELFQPGNIRNIADTARASWGVDVPEDEVLQTARSVYEARSDASYQERRAVHEGSMATVWKLLEQLNNEIVNRLGKVRSVYSTLPDYERYALTLLGDTQPDNSVLPYASFTVVHRGNRGTYINGDNILE